MRRSAKDRMDEAAVYRARTEAAQMLRNGNLVDVMKDLWMQNVLQYAQSPNNQLFNSDGSMNRGAAHRCAFWDGYNGVKNSINAGEKTSMTYAWYRAGIEFRKLQKV